MSFLGACLSLMMACGFGVLGILLTVRSVVSFCPGGLLLGLERLLFLWTQPFIEPISGWFCIRLGGRDWTPLALAAVCFLAMRGLSPWVALAGFKISAG